MWRSKHSDASGVGECRRTDLVDENPELAQTRTSVPGVCDAGDGGPGG